MILPCLDWAFLKGFDGRNKNGLDYSVRKKEYIWEANKLYRLTDKAISFGWMSLIVSNQYTS